MSYPVGPPPDGAYVVGSDYGQSVSETNALALMTGGVKGAYGDAQDSLRAVFGEIDSQFAPMKDAQEQMIDRVDLLEGVRGYCSLFLANNWQISGNKRITLPFNTQLGPNVGAVPWSSQGIRLLTKGLWRADAHVSFMTPPSNWLGTGFALINAWIKVVPISGGAGATAYTEKQYDATITESGPETINFSHTFVIPDDGAYAVVVQVNQPKSSTIGLYGGTMRSALSVNKWDNGTVNNAIAPTVPDGGTLS